MTIQQEILPPESQDIIELVFENPALAIRDEEKAKAFLVKVREHALSIGEKDMGKAKDRDEVRSMASKVTKSKTMLNSARLEMTAGLRKEVEEINAAGKVLTAGLAEIADEVRAPLTAWETAEKEREDLVETTIARIKAAALVTISDTAASVSARGNEIYEIEIDPAVFKKRTDEATDAQAVTIKALHEAMNVLREREEMAAKLAAMEAEKAEREAKEAAEKVEREAQERKVQYARSIIDHIHEVGRGMIGGQTYPYAILLHELQVKIPPEITTDFGDLEQEARRILAETLEHVQAAADLARQRANEEAQREAAEKAKRDADEAAQREIDAANLRAKRAEDERQAELKRIADKEAEDKRIAEAQAAEQARRERSRKHRADIMGKIKHALIEHGKITEAEAVAITKAMVAGNVPNVSVQF